MKIKVSELKKLIKESVHRNLLEQTSFVEDDDKHTEDKKHTALTWGTIPSVEKIAELMGSEPFTMDLKGMDKIAWDYSMALSDEPLAGNTDTPEELHTTLEALMETQDPELLSDEEYDEVESILDAWFVRYPDYGIEDIAYSLASGILNTLGVEWI